MKIGIDGNMWYCSNGMCLGNPRSKFTFSRILRDCVKEYRKKYDINAEVPPLLLEYMDSVPEEFTGGFIKSATMQQ